MYMFFFVPLVRLVLVSDFANSKFVSAESIISELLISVRVGQFSLIFLKK